MRSNASRYREVLLVGALLVYPLITFLTTARSGRAPNFLDRAVLGLASPLERGLSWLFDGVRDGAAGWVALRGVRERNAVLEIENGKLRAELNELRESVIENQRLKRALNYADATPEREIVARIIGVNPSPVFLSVRVDRGADEGVQLDMPVVTHDGVIGRVRRATGGYADVQLVIDPGIKVGVLVQRSRARGTVLGTGSGKPLLLDNVLRDEDVKVDDVVVTSGTDGVFPRGLVVGKVARVERGVGNSMFLRVLVSPAVEPTHLEEVLVVPSGQHGLGPSALAPKGGAP